jgi:DNA-binding winged helix-turn-helix (wHTH) protein
MSGDFAIGEWNVQPSLNRLTRGQDVVRLEPKVMQVLVCLADGGGDVVTREELIARVWPDVFVTDDVLHRAIGELRRVFGDSHAAPRYIETIRKRGYRLVQATTVTSEDGPPAAVPIAPAGLDPTRRWTFSVAATLLLVLCGALFHGVCVARRGIAGFRAVCSRRFWAAQRDRSRYFAGRSSSGLCAARSGDLRLRRYLRPRAGEWPRRALR